MTNYSSNESMVRVSRFKPSGKWYDDQAIDMAGHYAAPSLRDAILECWETQGSAPRRLEPGWMLVCLEPYHQHAHPQLIIGK